MNTVIIKNGFDLTQAEYTQINNSLLREFTVSLPSKDLLKNRLFFLLKNNDEIISMGALMTVTPVIFNGKEYSLLGFVNIVANIKGKGYGKQIVLLMKDYLGSHRISGFGFCMMKNQGFYLSCGFQITTNSTRRFIYRNGDKKITNQDGQIIFYFDADDLFFQNILKNSDKDIYLPTQDLW